MKKSHNELINIKHKKMNLLSIDKFELWQKESYVWYLCNKELPYNGERNMLKKIIASD